MTLPATTDCAASGAICTGEGRPLSEAVSVTVAQEIETEIVIPLTVSLIDVPHEHDGSTAVVFEVRFSRSPTGFSFRTLRDETLQVTQGETVVTPGVRRMEQGSNRRWEVTVEQASGVETEDISVVIEPTNDCAAPGAVCADGQMLSNGVTATILGPPGLSVADARAEEGVDETIDFDVTMSRASVSTVTVDYATSDGTGESPATAGEDYEATSGTLTFAPGETAKTVSVPILDDPYDEGEETLTLTLSNPQGGNAYLADAEAVGTIENHDAMPRAWLARFGRTVAEQVIDAVEGRLSAARSAGTEVTLAGQALGTEMSEEERTALEEREAKERLDALSRWLNGETDEDDNERELTGRDLLTGTTFSMTSGTPEGGYAALWGRGAVSRFDGQDGHLTINGEVESVMLGGDFARAHATFGMMVAHSRGDGTYRSPEGNGDVESTLTGLYPYGQLELNRRVSLRGVAGYGSGELALTPEGLAPLETDMSLAMGAVGVRGVAVEAPAEGGVELAVTSDAMLVRTSSARTTGLAAADADVARLRLGVEGTWRGIETGAGAFVPTLEVGVRRDAGDAETGFGLDAGAGLAWSHPGLGLSAQVNARGLLTHQSEGFDERGVAGSLTYDARPDSDRGLTFSVSQTMGAQASGGTDALLGHRHLGDLAGKDEGDAFDQRALEFKGGYGIPMWGNRFTGTPEARLALSDSHREYGLGWRLGLSRTGPVSMELGLEATRRESRNDGAAEPVHALMLRGSIRF